jgi:hypothetical protein
MQVTSVLLNDNRHTKTPKEVIINPKQIVKQDITRKNKAQEYERVQQVKRKNIGAMSSVLSSKDRSTVSNKDNFLPGRQFSSFNTKESGNKENSAGSRIFHSFKKETS